ncbi:DUF512 domain-containing protein [Roseburia sp. NSJ-9]|uniref:DUF512 domain-containing protein n=1 Tax=Roseburia lenta TaxID=2763061 RepID=A0ABR7GC99_9FIRM|nr:DUF512 domain-containing protein [Roseburia lenta]MBC5685059.1 DUF512 domain-containing protein [Roseburia lenta]
MSTSHQIAFVRSGSPAALAGVEPMDIIKEINGVELIDIFDYYYYEDEPAFEMLIEKPDQTRHLVHITKSEGEDLGITFENGLMDDYRSCHNKCMFCFIDQMPPGMRETLYFKDDDTRLSFLQGNYVTLTNMKEEDLKRIIHYHLAPINISVQATNPELRCKMLHNRFAGDILDKIKMLADADIEMNAQIVLCKGENDGAELDRSIGDLLSFYPQMQSMSVVPVGLTKFREGLYPLEPFEREEAREVLATIHKWQDISFEKYGTHFVQASDEWYLIAGYDLPTEERYDGYTQLENGVGMIRLLMDEFREALAKEKKHPFMRKKECAIATGRLAAPFIRMLCQEFMEKFPKVTVYVYEIRNDFFGEKITVSGLITGQDLMAQLKGQPLGSHLLLPQNMVRAEEQDFLDDVTVAQLSDALQVKVDIVKSSGQDLVKQLITL